MDAQEVDVKKVAALAKLKLNDREVEYLQEQFKKIMGYIDSISKVEITDEMEAKDESLQQIYREDKVEKSNISLDSFSPYVEDGHFKVPRVIE